MDIETLLLKIAKLPIKFNDIDLEFLHSCGTQIYFDIGFTQQQRSSIYFLLKRYEVTITSFFVVDVDLLFREEAWALPMQIVPGERTIKVIGSDTPKLIEIKFSFNQKLTKMVKSSIVHNTNSVLWDSVDRCWRVILSAAAVVNLQELVNTEYFQVDAEFQSYLDQVKTVSSSIDLYAPMVVLENGIPILKNAAVSVPPLTESEIIPALFQARLRGITVWSSEIHEYVTSGNFDYCTEKFLCGAFGDQLQFNSNVIPIESLTDLIKNLGPTLVVLPTCNTLEKVTLCREFFSTLGIKSSEMSVMFRLPTKTYSDFNKYVHTEQLNSPITDQTKIVFVSYNMPKPVLQSNIKFNFMLNMGNNSLSKPLNRFQQSHPNIVHFSDL